jgi:inorganic pyrophosphatase
MSATKFPQEAKKFEIQAYKKPKDLKNLRKTHVPYSGSPQKHPYDPDKFILIADPFSNNTFYYEFMIEAIASVEELPNLVNLEGEAIPMARIWVKKMSVGILCSPFVVADAEDGK